ncbi:TPA: aquarius-like [Bos taurus]|nr:TPA: aquarius-like [Bos taurus]
MTAPAQPKKIVAPTVSQINAEFVTQSLPTKDRNWQNGNSRTIIQTPTAENARERRTNVKVVYCAL